MAQTLTLVTGANAHMCPGEGCALCRWIWVRTNGPRDVDDRRLLWRSMRVTPHIAVDSGKDEA